MYAAESLDSPGFSWQQALSMGTASKLSYEQPHIVENVFTNSWGYQQFTFIDIGETQCFVAEADSHAVLAFRGTKGLGDWLGNLNVIPVSQPYGVVHKGFFDSYHDVHRQVSEALPELKPVWITGHSLGGALAAIASAELLDQRNIRGIYTFGQPRTGNDEFQNTINDAYQMSFFRFVNDDDVVTRIPPGFIHVGTLIHFDSNGSVKQQSAEAENESLELEPMSPQRFSEMQNEILEMRETLQGHIGEAEIEEAIDVNIEGFLPSARDHKIDRYIAHIRRQIRDEIDVFQIDSSRQMTEATERGFRSPLQNIPDSEKISVLIRLNRQDWEAPDHLVINSRFGTFATAQATPSDLENLKADSAVASIEVSGDAGIEELDASIPFVKADEVHRPPLDERGDQAIIGIIDTGIDILHEVFKDDSGASRILGVWDQRNNFGPTPLQVDSTAFSQDYGTLYLNSDIENYISDPVIAPAALRDPGGHGTHVASIAAGRGVGQINDGMAPAASLVVVIPNSRTLPGDPPSIGYSVSHVDALSFLKSVSAGGNAVSQTQLPMAVNVSLGMNAGAHDGSSTLEAAFDSISGGGRDPGFVIVKSAGNERGHGGHARVRAYAGGITEIKWDSTGFRFQDYFEVWFHALDEFRFIIQDPAGNQSTAVDESNLLVDVTLGGNLCRLRLTSLHPDNGDNRLTITILPQSEAIQTGVWRLRIEGVSLGSGEGFVDAWVERDNNRPVSFDPEDPKMTISIPGTADTVIAVGASDSQIPFTLLGSSSYGLTRDNRPKPEIVAPGAGINAADSNQSNFQASTIKSGTSMAAPHVTGALALVLSGRQKTGSPQYNAQQLRKGLIVHAQARSGYHNEGSGWGVLDAANLFSHLV